MKSKTRIALVLIPVLAASAAFHAGCSKTVNKTIIRMAVWESIPVNNQYKQLAREYMKLHPRITIKIEPVPGSKARQKLMTGISGHSAPDIMQMHYTWFYDFARKNIFEPLDSYLKTDPIWKWDDYFAIGKKSYRYHDTQYGIPQKGSAIVMLYNRSLFKKAHIAEPDDSWKWKDFIHAARTLTVNANRQFGYNLNKEWKYVVPWIWMAGGKIMSKDKTRFIFNSTESLIVLNMINDWYYRYHITPSPADAQAFGSKLQMFYTGKIAMDFSGPWRLAELKKQNLDWDIHYYPIGPSGKRITRYAGTGYTIWKGSKHKREAWNFLKFICSQHSIEKLAAIGADIPPIRSVAWSPVIINPGTPYHEERFVEALKHARRLTDFTNEMYIDDTINSELEKMFSTKQPPNVTAENITHKVNEIIRQQR